MRLKISGLNSFTGVIQGFLRGILGDEFRL